MRTQIKHSGFGILMILTLMGCYGSEFSSSMRSANGFNADGLGVAVLKNLPANPSNDVKLNVTVTGVEAYVYALVDGDPECRKLSYSSIRPVSQIIDDEIGADGKKKLCVKGVSEGVIYQLAATEHAWVKDSHGPGEFSVVAIDEFLVQSPKKVEWSVSEGADYYRVAVSTELSCANPVARLDGQKVNELALKPLQNGKYYVCASALDKAGNERKAENYGLSFTVDNVPPKAFFINRPLARTNAVRPQIAWTLAVGAASYNVKVATDEACSAVVSSLTTTNLDVITDKDLADGQYFACVSAVDASGNERSAENQPYSFVVDSNGQFIKFVENTLPGDPSNAKNLAVALTGAPLYRYKIGPADENFKCEDPSEYSQDRSINDKIETSIENLADGRFAICAYGSDDTGKWVEQASQNFVRFEWTKDTVNPIVSFSVASLCGPNICQSSSGQFELKNGLVGDDIGVAKVEVSVQNIASQLYLQNTSFNAAAPVWVSATLNHERNGFTHGFARNGIENDQTYKIIVRVTDLAGNSVSVSRTTLWDESKPVISSFKVMSLKPVGTSYLDDIVTRLNFLKSSLAASDSSSHIVQYCIKYMVNNAITSVPLDDTCWISLENPSRTISLNNIAAKVGFIEAKYRLRLWVKDAAGNISGISGSVQDAMVDYKPVKPPVFSHLYATYSSSVAEPSVNNTVPPSNNATQSVYIRWNVGTTNPDGLKPGKPIKLYYTQNDANFVEIASGTVAANHKDECSLSINPSGAKNWSGCFKFTATANANLDWTKYIRFRIVAEDADGAITYGQTNAINLKNFRFLAGNTEPGLGATSTASIFMPKGATQSLAVHPTGRIFVLDTRGLITVDPKDGVQRLIVPLSSMTIWSIAMDYNYDLLLQTSNAIYRMKVSNEVGAPVRLIGGGTDSSDLVQGGDKFRHALVSNSFFATKNGDIYFFSGNRSVNANGGIANVPVLRRYTPDGFIRTVEISGTRKLLHKGFENQSTVYPTVPDQNIASCRPKTVGGIVNAQGALQKLLVYVVPTGYSPSLTECFFPHYGDSAAYSDIVPLDFQPTNQSFVLNKNLTFGSMLTQHPRYLEKWRESTHAMITQGMDGRLYSYSYANSVGTDNIYRLDTDTNSWKMVAGGLYGGECADRTDKTSCALNVSSIFVDAQGTIFMLDNSAVRVIQEDGLVVTISGQSRTSGDGANPLSARFRDIMSFGIWPKNGGSNAKYVISDVDSPRIREFKENGSITSIAGNGIDVDGDIQLPASQTSMTWGGDGRNFSLQVDNNGNVYASGLGQIRRLERTQGKWQIVTKTSGTGYPAMLYGLAANYLLFGRYNYSNSLGSAANGQMFITSVVPNSDGGYKDINAELILDKPGTEDEANRINNANPFCASGTNRLNCNGVGTNENPGAGVNGFLDNGKWLLGINHYPTSGELYSRLVHLPITANAANDKITDFLVMPGKRLYSFTVRDVGSDRFIYACMSDGKIHKYNYNTRAFIGTVAFPISTMSCGRSRALEFNGNWLVFGYSMNNLSGLAAIENP